MGKETALDGNVLDWIAGKSCAVAVSGGSDSLALLHLLKRQSSAQLQAVTIDHGLRPDARQEAEYVAQICKKIDIPHTVVRVNVEAGNTQAQARLARYNALTKFCLNHQISYLLTGHTQDDQVETYFLNSFRGSGVDGLAAMPVRKGKAPMILRPMLSLRRKNLRNYLNELGVAWVEDPSNLDESFDRIRLRNWLQQGEELGFSFASIERTTQNMARLQNYMHANLISCAKEICRVSYMDVEVRIERRVFLKLHEDMQLRLLAKLCQFYGGSPYKPRLSSLENLRLSFEDGKGGQSLERTDFHWDDEDIVVCAEPAHLPPMSTSPHWSRFTYKGEMSQFMRIGPLHGFTRAFDEWNFWGISARAASALPCLFRADAPVSADWSNFECRGFLLFLQNA